MQYGSKQFPGKWVFELIIFTYTDLHAISHICNQKIVMDGHQNLPPTSSISCFFSQYYFSNHFFYWSGLFGRHWKPPSTHFSSTGERDCNWFLSSKYVPFPHRLYNYCFQESYFTEKLDWMYGANFKELLESFGISLLGFLLHWITLFKQ